MANNIFPFLFWCLWTYVHLCWMSIWMIHTLTVICWSMYCMIVLHELMSNPVPSFFKAAPIPHGLDRIPDILGYLVINSDGAVLAVSVWLRNQTFDVGLYLTNTYQLLPCACSVVDHRWHWNVVKTKDLQMSVAQGSLSNDNDNGSENVNKNEFTSFQTLLHLFGSAQFVRCKRLFLEL